MSRDQASGAEAFGADGVSLLVSVFVSVFDSDLASLFPFELAEGAGLLFFP
jgi:hypothetical protein